MVGSSSNLTQPAGSLAVRCTSERVCKVICGVSFDGTCSKDDCPTTVRCEWISYKSQTNSFDFDKAQLQRETLEPTQFLASGCSVKLLFTSLPWTSYVYGTISKIGVSTSVPCRMT